DGGRRLGRRLGREAAGVEHRAAFLGQLRHGEGRLANPRLRAWNRRLCRLDRSLLQHGVPVVELLAAAVVARYILLVLAAIHARRAVDAHMEVIVMVPPGPHLAEPGRILAGLRGLLDRNLLYRRIT